MGRRPGGSRKPASEARGERTGLSDAVGLDYTGNSSQVGHLDQRLDRLLHTQEVVGSNPTVPTTPCYSFFTCAIKAESAFA